MTVTTQKAAPAPAFQGNRPHPPRPGTATKLLASQCLICSDDDAEPLAVGQDFSLGSTAETYLAVRCRACGLVYLNPTPGPGEPEHADTPSLRLSRRVTRFCRSLGESARVLDGSRIDECDPTELYRAVLLTGVLERASDPLRILQAARRLLDPEGLILVTTPNAESMVCSVFQGRHWSGYDFPRCRNLFCAETLGRAARIAGLELVSAETVATPEGWLRSLENLLHDWSFPNWVTTGLNRFSGVALAAAAAVEWWAQRRGRGGLLFAILRAPVS
jgi:hypothetical protein